MAYINAHLALLEEPYELYRHASDETRRQLNQAIFAHIYVVHDEVVGDELNSPLAELLAAERGWSAFQADLDDEAALEAAQSELARHSPENKQSVPKGNALSNALLADLLTTVQNGGDCSKPSMVHYIDLSWNTIEPSLVLMYEKLIDLGWVYYNGAVHIVEPETEESQHHAR